MAKGSPETCLLFICTASSAEWGDRQCIARISLCAISFRRSIDRVFPIDGERDSAHFYFALRGGDRKPLALSLRFDSVSYTRASRVDPSRQSGELHEPVFCKSVHCCLCFHPVPLTGLHGSKCVIRSPVYDWGRFDPRSFADTCEYSPPPTVPPGYMLILELACPTAFQYPVGYLASVLICPVEMRMGMGA